MILFIFFVLATISATTVSAQGSGATAEDAQLNAQVQLASKISVKITSLQKTLTYDDGSTNQNQLYESIKAKTDIELIGIKYKDLSQKGKIYYVTAYLDEGSLFQYLNKLNDLKASISEIEARDKVGVSLETKKRNLSVLISYYEQFEIYRTVALALDDMANVPHLTRTKAGAELDLYNLLEQENILLKAYTTSSMSQFDSQRIISEFNVEMSLSEIQKKFEENQVAINFYEQQGKIRQKELQDKADQNVQSIINRMVQSAQNQDKQSENPVGSKNDPLTYIYQIETWKQEYAKINNNLQLNLSNQQDQINSTFNTRLNEIKAEPYRAAELKNGVPTDEAKSFRDQRIADLNNERLVKIESMKMKLESSVKKRLDELENQILEGYSELESTTFTSNSRNNTFTIKIGDYDGYQKSWPIAIRLSILEETISFDTYLPYQAVTGKALPGIGSRVETSLEAYSEYLDEVDIFNLFFASVVSPFNIAVSYSVVSGLGSSEYVISLIEGEISRSDTQTTVLKISSSQAKNANTVAYVYSPSTPFAPNFIRVKNAEDSKIAKEAQKQRSEIAMKAFFGGRNRNGRRGFSLGIGFTSELVEDITNLEDSNWEIGFACTTEYIIPLSSNWYTGISIGYFGMRDPEAAEFLNETYGLSGLIGYCTSEIFPVSLPGSYAFIEIKGGITSLAFVTHISLGMIFNPFQNMSQRHESNGFTSLMYMTTTYQLSGINSGMTALLLGFIFKFDTRA